MRALDFSVQLRCAAFYVRVADALVLDVPVEFGLKFVAVVGTNFADPERELFDDVIDEIDCIGLGMFLADLERPDARRVVYGGILEATNFLAARTMEGEEFDIHLDVMAGDLFVVAFRVDLPKARSARQAAYAIAPEDSTDAGFRDFDGVVAREIPDDPDRAEVIGFAQMKDFVDDLKRRPVGGVLWDRLGVDKTGFAKLSVGSAPAVEARPANAEVSASLRHTT